MRQHRRCPVHPPRRCVRTCSNWLLYVLLHLEIVLKSDRLRFAGFSGTLAAALVGDLYVRESFEALAVPAEAPLLITHRIEHPRDLEGR